jgi:hypothetical protein
MNMVKAISGLTKIMGMVLMKENKNNPMIDCGNYVRTTSINDGNLIKTIAINGNFAKTTIDNGKSTM